MRLRLLRRRLTISAPRVAIRSALPWPLRWLVVALVLGLSGAAALWAFEFGKAIAGLESVSRDEVMRLRSELEQLREQSSQRQHLSETAESLLAADRATLERLTAQVKLLESENRMLRDDLGFFEKLMPATKGDGVAIKGFQVEVLSGVQLRWQMLVIQSAARNAPEFKGRVEVAATGMKDGKPWSQSLPPEGKALQFKQYRRVEEILTLPPNVVVKTVTARVWEGQTVRASQTIELD